MVNIGRAVFSLTVEVKMKNAVSLIRKILCITQPPSLFDIHTIPTLSNTEKSPKCFFSNEEYLELYGIDLEK